MKGTVICNLVVLEPATILLYQFKAAFSVYTLTASFQESCFFVLKVGTFAGHALPGTLAFGPVVGRDRLTPGKALETWRQKEESKPPGGTQQMFGRREVRPGRSNPYPL